jgi:hypothetical protein
VVCHQFTKNLFGVLYFSAPPVSSLRCCYKNLKKLYDLLSSSFQIFQSLLKANHQA